jgi:hypothetical protein
VPSCDHPTGNWRPLIPAWSRAASATAGLARCALPLAIGAASCATGSDSAMLVPVVAGERPDRGRGRVAPRAVRIVYCADWTAVVSQPSRFDIACAQLTTARTWPESSDARHRTDHG